MDALSTYFVSQRNRAGVATIGAVCPFCELAIVQKVPGRELAGPRQFLSITCPRCNIQETYAPAHQTRRSRAT